MTDLNNRPGGPNLIVTAKTAHKVHFVDAATLTMQSTIDMPGSTHELALSADGRTAYGTVYGDGVFAKRVNPDRRIVVIDLPSKSLKRVIDLGAVYAPHGVMMDEQGTLWSSGELGNAVLAIDPASDKVEKIDVGSTAHWVAISHATGKVFASVKSNYLVGDRCRAPRGHRSHRAAARGRGARDLARRRHASMPARRMPPSSTSSTRVRTRSRAPCRSTAPTPRRSRCAGCGCRPTTTMSWCRRTRTITSRSTSATRSSRLHRCRSRSRRWVLASRPDGKHAYICCHDDAEVFEFELATGRVTRTFPTAAGCEFIVAYH